MKLKIIETYMVCNEGGDFFKLHKAELVSDSNKIFYFSDYERGTILMLSMESVEKYFKLTEQYFLNK